MTPMHRGTCRLALVGLLAATSAQAQPAAPEPQRAAVPGCYVFTPYGLVPTCTLSPRSQDELASTVAAYLTDGARVTAAGSDAGADYFHNAAQTLAAPTTSWVATVDPDVGAGAFGTRTAPTPSPTSRVTADASAAPQLAEASAAALSAAPAHEDASSPSRDAALAPELTERTVGPATPPPSATGSVHTPGESPRAAYFDPLTLPVPAPSGAPFPPRFERQKASPTGMDPSILWVVVMTPLTALLLFLGVRTLAARTRGVPAVATRRDDRRPRV